jgi:glycosyltransferase involved in cell wall biosynthesis
VRIAIDLTATFALPAGIDRHLSGLVSSLARIDRDNEYVLFANLEDRGRFLAEGVPPNFRLWFASARPRVPRLLFQQLIEPALLACLRIDVLHSPVFLMPLYRGRQRHVLTIHDMTSFLHADCHPPIRRGRVYESAVGAFARRADLVTVPSASVRDDLLALVPGVRPERVRVIRSGVSARFRPQEPEAVRRVIERMGIRWPYVLFVGTIEPRKNLSSLLAAFGRLVADRQTDHHLIVAGKRGWSTDAVFEAALAPELRDRVHFVGYVPEEDLPALYGGASVFAFPSLAEGFGFPPLEAMACGVPVVAALTSALRDNLTGAAELVPPEDSAALGAAIARLLSDERLRSERGAAGIARAAAFRWDASARETLECYRELAA